MIDLTALLQNGVVLPSLAASSRKHVFHALCAELAVITQIDEREIFDAVMQRERLGSTGVGEGVAIPHARLEGLEQPLGAFARLEAPVDFEALDDRPCDLVFMLLAPINAGADHLRALAAVSRAFREASVRDALREAVTQEEVTSILCKRKTAA